MATGHPNPGQGKVVTRLLPSEEEARVRNQFLLDQIRERARITWCQSDQWSRSEPTTYQSHFQGQRVNCEDRTIQRPASTTRKHKPQSNKWFYITTFNSHPAHPNEDSRIQCKDNKQQEAAARKERMRNADPTSSPYEIDQGAAVEVLRELDHLSRSRTDGSTWRGDFSMRPEWRPTIRHHRLRPLSPPLPIQSHQ